MKRQFVSMQQTLLCFMAFVFAMQITGCSSTVELVSAWKRTDMLIDGNPNDWEGDLYNLKKANVTIGVRNDETNLYLCFSSNDPNVRRQILRGGFTVWFDPTGGTDETYGIQFPVGFSKGESDDGGNFAPVPDAYNTARSPSEIDGNNPNGKMSVALNSSQSEVRFLGPNKDDVLLSTLIELKTMKVQVGLTRQSFVYELQVPLHKTNDFPFSIAPINQNKNILGIEYKSGAGSSFDHNSGPSGSDATASSSGSMNNPENRNGMDESERRGMGRYGRGGSESKTSGPIELWTKVPLAQK